MELKKTQKGTGDLDETAKIAIDVERGIEQQKQETMFKECNIDFPAKEISVNKLCVVTMGVRLLK